MNASGGAEAAVALREENSREGGLTMLEKSIALNRFGLGGRSGDGPGSDPKRWLLGQLDHFEAHPAAVASQAPSSRIVGELASYQVNLLELQRIEREKPPAPAKPDPMAGGMKTPAADENYSQNAGNDPVNLHRRNGRLQARSHYGSAVAARTTIAVASNTPFVERLTHFWANHFAISADKLEVLALGGSMEFEAIRPHVLGNFKDMLLSVERHPAMLLYLDQAQSVGPGSEIARRAPGSVKLGLNENLAREIMELHTLGVRTVYTQSDVTELARALTGWTVAGLSVGRGGTFGSEGQTQGYFFSPPLHEPGARTILGKSYADAGERQAVSVLEALATHPATAKHLATKLARHFGGDEPPVPLVARLETAFLKSNGDLPTVYRALIESPECWAPKPLKFKSPWEWAISAMRALDTERVQPGETVSLFGQLGQPVWRPGSPAGWDDVASAWVGPDAIMRRVEAAERLAQQQQGSQLDARQRSAELFPDALSETTRRTIARAGSPTQALALMLVTPEFMRR